MSRFMTAVCAAVVVCAGSVVLPAMQLQTPTNWKWRTDSPATVNDAAVAHPGEGTARNIFKVEVMEADVVFSMNDKEVARLPKAQVTTDGFFGLRAGANMNLHVSTFDATYVLAPVPVKK